MITVTKLRNGTNFELDGSAYRVLNYQHTHMSRGGGSVKVRIRNLVDGNVINKTFQSTEKVDEIQILKRKLQYLYKEDTDYVFMDPDTFEQIEVSVDILEDQGFYLKEGEITHVLIWDEKELVLGVDLPPKMVFEIVEAAPGEKGDSASNVYKDALLENGLKVRVPLFINPGDKVRVDTRDGSYVERSTA
jgi:elongation factor P